MPNIHQPYFIGVSGGSASGKTRMVHHIRESLHSDLLTVISQDNYYHDIEEQEKEPDGSINFDHPKAVNLELLYNHLRQLQDGHAVSIREYTFNNPELTPRMLTFRPAPIILLEGLFVFHYRPVAELLDLKVYVDADEHLKLARRLRRDISERGYDLEDILEQYERQTMPMYQAYVAPHKTEADLIIYNNRHFRIGAEVIVNHLRQLLEDPHDGR